jgi:hypothetical protein
MKYHEDILGLFFSFIVSVVFWKILIIPNGYIVAIVLGIICFLLYKYIISDEIVVFSFAPVKSKLYLTCFVLFSILAVLLIPSVNNSVEFVPWAGIPLLSLLRLLLSLFLAIFFPGYLILGLIGGRMKLNMVENILVSIFISFTILPFFGILSFAVGSSIYTIGNFLIVLLNLVLLVAYVFKKESVVTNKTLTVNFNEKLLLLFLFIFIVLVYIFSKYSQNLTWDFGDLDSYYGFSLSFTKHTLPQSVIGPGLEYPFWMFISLAEYFVASGLPFANAYQFIVIFLILVPILSLYVMFSAFFKDSKYKKIPIIATTLGFFGGGFGWLYGLATSPNINVNTSQGLFDLFNLAAKTDTGYLALPMNPLYTLLTYYIAVAVTFTLIWLVYSKRALNLGNLRYVLTSVMVALGYLDYIVLTIVFIIIFLFSLVIISREQLSSYRKYAISIGVGLLVVALVDFLMGGSYYTAGDALTKYGFSIFYIALLVVGLSIALSFFKPKLNFPSIPKSINDKVFIVRIGVSSLIIFFYGLSFIIVAKVIEASSYLPTYNHIVPWYAWPMRLGILGLVALPGIIFWICRGKSIKENLFFLFLFLISFGIGRIFNVYPFYYEDRLTFLIMLPILMIVSWELLAFSEKLKKMR